MIKITLIKEDFILHTHYKTICDDFPDGRYSVLNMFDKYINKFKLDPIKQGILNYLKDKVKKDASGFSIITAQPHELSNFIKNFEALYPRLDNTLKKALKCIFYYKEYGKWQAYNLASMIKVSVCPYCNRSYTFAIGSDATTGTRFEYDHFYSQEDYPYLALSFYNLVPSCHICNANLKKRAKFTFDTNMHPYVDGFGDEIKFSIEPRSINFINGVAASYDVILTGWKNVPYSKAKKALNNIKTFRLLELYNLHKDYIDEIIIKAKIYNSDYVDTLYNQYAGTLFNSKDDVRRNLMGNYLTVEDSGARVLAKLSRDISVELKIF